MVVSLLQEQYGFAYGMTGTLLSLMSIGNLLEMCIRDRARISRLISGKLYNLAKAST